MNLIKTETKTIINEMDKEGENNMLHMLETKLEEAVNTENSFCVILCAGGSECRNVIEEFEYELYENRLILHMDNYELYVDFDYIETFYIENKEVIYLRENENGNIYTELYFN